MVETAGAWWTEVEVVDEVALDPRVTVNEGSFVLGADFLTSLSGFFHKIQPT